MKRKKQIAFADRILLNKTDLVTPAALDELEHKIRGMNAIAKIYRTQNAIVEMDAILGVGGFDLDRALIIDPDFLGEEAHQHDESVGSVALVAAGAMDITKIQAWLGELLPTQGQNIFRMKGILNIHEREQRFVLQGVHMIMEIQPDRVWQVGEERQNQLVLIGRNLDRTKLAQDFYNCLVP